jgi:hypothetical protein
MKKEVYKCDGPSCSKTKAEVNRWLIGKLISAPSSVRQPWGYAIGPWDDSIADSCDHFCGHQCALAKLNEFLQTRQEAAHA